MNTTLKKMSGLAPEDLEGTVEFLDEQARLKPYYWLLHAEEALLSVARATDPRMRAHLADVFSDHLEEVAKADPMLLNEAITTAREGDARAWAEGVEDFLLTDLDELEVNAPLVEAYRAEREIALQVELEVEQDLVVGAALLASQTHT